MAKSKSPKKKQGPKKVFVIWDMTIENVELTLESARENTDWQVLVPGKDEPASQIWSSFVEPGLRTADFVLALVDKPNANVGFEIGYALGLGRVVRLATVQTALPKWMEAPPFQQSYFLRNNVDDIEVLESVVERDEGLEVPPKPRAGQKTLLLCPQLGQAKAIRRRLMKHRQDWNEPPRNGWTLEKLPEVLKDIGRVVWVVVGSTSERDGAENTALSVIAGYALACGIELRVWRHKGHRSIVDQAQIAHSFGSLDDLLPLVESLALAPGVELQIDVLAAYRAYLTKQHDLVIPLFREARERAFEDIYVPLDVACAMDETGVGRNELAHFGRSTTLRGLLEAASVDKDPVRWVIAGDPGAGKSTMCRRLAWEVGQEPEGPLVVMVSLPRLLRERRHPFDIAEADMCAVMPALGKFELAKQLRERAARRGGVWLLLDALDEVGSDTGHELWNRLTPLLADLPNAAVVITSRKIGLEKIPQFQRADVQPLSEKRRAELVEQWLSDKSKATSVLAHIDRCPQLAQLSTNPLMLTLMVAVSLEAASAPSTARELYERAIELLLKRGASPETPKPVAHPTSAALLLPHLALKLMESGRLSWTRTELVRTLFELTSKHKNQDHAERLQQYVDCWGSPDKLIHDLGDNSGLLGPFDSSREPWKFWHRSLCEFLAAQRLAELPAKALQARIKELSTSDERGEAIQFWGQTYGMACALVGAAERVATLEAVRSASPALALRALPFVDTLPAADGFEFLLLTAGWEGESLLSLARSWQPMDASKLIRGRLSTLAKAGRRKFDLDLLAQLLYVLDAVEPKCDVDEILRDFGVATKPDLAFSDIPAGRFVMGDAKSPFEWDKTEHEVQLTPPFRLGCTAITEAQFACLDLSRKHEQSEENLPARGVSWYGAWLFCRWLGGSLPTEAQWEYACRAQQDEQRDSAQRTRFWSGDSEEALARVGWYHGNSGSRARPVGEKPANAWGLHDMHGNVWEWCSDWFGDYSAERIVDPAGPAVGYARVIRGGSFKNDADACRSAYRSGVYPFGRGNFLGFRVALPAAPSSR